MRRWVRQRRRVVKKQRHLGRTHGGTPHTLPSRHCASPRLQLCVGYFRTP